MRTETEWRTWMFSVARRRTCCDADADDIVQDVLLRFWVAFGVLPWEHSESQWARVVCQRWIRLRAAELWRSACMRHECALDELAQVPSWGDEGSETHLVEHTEYQLLLQDIARVLSPQQWRMLRLYLEGYTYEEIAKQLGVCSGTVKRQFSRIHHKAQSVLSTFWGCERELIGGGTNYDDSDPNFAAEENAGGGRVAMHSPCAVGVLRGAGCLVLCFSVSLFANAQLERTKQMAHEILQASIENNTLVVVNRDGYHLTAGLYLPSVPADGESLVWGVVTLMDAAGKPVPNAAVELNATAGTIRWIEPHPLTDSEGAFIFALQSTVSPSSFQIRIHFPQFGIGGTLSGTFCRIGALGCFLPPTCAGISAAWEYYPVENDSESLTCATTVADRYKFYASDAPEPPVIYFDYVTFKNDRPEGAFPERRLYLSYAECQNIFGYDQFCRCLRGFKEGVADLTYGWGQTFGGMDYGLPNGENIAEVTYLQYQAGSPGRVCKKEFRFHASSPLVRLSNEWIMFTDENPTPTVEVEVFSPHWQGDMWLTLQYGTEQRRHLVQVPGRYTFTLERSLYSMTGKNTPYQVQAILRADRGYAYEVTTSDTTESFVRMDDLTVWASGYNPQSRTFDFAISYRLSCTRPQFTRTPLVSQGYIAVYYGNDLSQQIHAEHLSSAYFTAGQHTVMVRIPENQMTRFGTYRFIPHFTDNFARYYRDDSPRRVKVGSAPSFTTPTINEVRMVYSVRGVPVLNNTTQTRLMYPYAGDEIDIVALMSAGRPNEASRRYAYGPVPRTSVYIDEASWDGSAQSEWRGEARPDTNFFNRPIVHLARIERNGALSGAEAGHWLWPGPKLEFRWVEITHHTGETKDRTYWYTMREIDSGSPVYSLTAQRGTKRYAVAVTNPHWDYYIVGGIGRVPKNQWSQYLNGNTKINRATARAAARISARERITGSDTNYRLRLLEWATAFLDVRYDLGGCWFGGRVHTEAKDQKTGYQGFGIDCSKQVTVAARMEGITWPRDWREIDTGMLMHSAYTDEFPSEPETRIQIDRGDILVRRTETYQTTNPRTGERETRVKWRGHVMFVYSIEKSPIRNAEGEVMDYIVNSIQLLESTGAPANKVRIRERVSQASSRGRQRQCILRVLQNERNGYEVRRIPDRRR